MPDFIRITNPDIDGLDQKPLTELPLVSREAFDGHWAAKGWVQAPDDEDAPAVAEVPSPAPLTATTVDAQVAPAEAPAVEPGTPDATATDTDQAAAEAPAKRTARTR